MLVDERLPEPARGEVRVRVIAAGVGFPDVLIREGSYPGGPKRGHDMAEQVEAKLRAVLEHATVFTHLEPFEDPKSFDDTGLDRSEAVSTDAGDSRLLER